MSVSPAPGESSPAQPRLHHKKPYLHQESDQALNQWKGSLRFFGDIRTRQKANESHDGCPRMLIPAPLAPSQVKECGYLPRRRCPIRIPRCRAFCLRAPGVRFIAFEMDFTGILLFEWLLSSLSSCRVHCRRTILLAVLAISSSPS